jgi:hypothetical protein
VLFVCPKIFNLPPQKFYNFKAMFKRKLTISGFLLIAANLMPLLADGFEGRGAKPIYRVLPKNGNY